jgi:hypothetical protein
MTRPDGVPVRASLRSEQSSACVLTMPGLYDRRSRTGTSDVWHCGGGGRARLDHDERECVGRSDACVPSARSVRQSREESRDSHRWPYAGRGGRARGKNHATPAAIDGICGLSRTDGGIAPTEVSCPRRMVVILQLRTVRPTRRRVRPSDRHAARAIAMIGAVTASSCQLSPRSGLRSSRPSAMPQTSSLARAASVYGIDSPGTGSSRQASPSQR